MNRLIFATYVIVLAAVFVLIQYAPAPAAEIKFSAVILDQDGAPMTDCAKLDAENPNKCLVLVPLTLGRLASHALNQAEAGLSPQQIVTRGLLAERVYRAGDEKAAAIDVGTSDIELMKTVIAKAGYRPLVVVGAFRALDPTSVK